MAPVVCADMIIPQVDGISVKRQWEFSIADKTKIPLEFLIPDEQTYQPKLSSVEVRPPRRFLRLGKIRFPLGKPDVRLLRKSKPFWAVLGDYGIFNCVLRVPITFPAAAYQ